MTAQLQKIYSVHGRGRVNTRAVLYLPLATYSRLHYLATLQGCPFPFTPLLVASSPCQILARPLCLRHSGSAFSSGREPVVSPGRYGWKSGAESRGSWGIQESHDILSAARGTTRVLRGPKTAGDLPSLNNVPGRTNAKVYKGLLVYPVQNARNESPLECGRRTLPPLPIGRLALVYL
ncbi:hypothetical protein J6590_039953 [Homalodisca vitripennis]|nr:hypothetical protein J6590_039953 [Homalodisca vitripennis]